MKIADLDAEILDRVERIENVLARSLQDVHQKLNQGQDTFQFFGQALKAYRDAWSPQAHLARLHTLNEKYRADKQLGFPHRKILDVLLSRFDFPKNSFQEVHFSQLVREARIGKNMAKSYLDLLESKGYIERRSDGYRIFFRIRG